MFFLFGIPAILGILGILGIMGAIVAPGITLVVALLAVVFFQARGNRAGSGGLALVPHLVASGLVAFASVIVLLAQHFG